MKKILFISLLSIFKIVFTYGQEKVCFQLNESGYYETVDHKDFTVIPFNGKSSQEIYQILASNINGIYKSPKSVMSSVENTSISIRGYSDDLIRRKLVIVGWVSCTGYYNLNFQIRDGRVRVSVPQIDNDSFKSFGDIPKTFREVVSSKFKNNTIKDKEKEYFDICVLKMNDLINSILGLTQIQKAGDDW